MTPLPIHRPAGLAIVGLLLSHVAVAETPAEFPQYEPTWDSLNQHDTPQWLLDAKLGLYAHWGVYSVTVALCPHIVAART